MMGETTQPETASEHEVLIEFSTMGMTPSLRFVCHANQDAPCRSMCERAECEEGCIGPGEHPRVRLPYCNAVEWFENGDDVETWVAGGRTSASLPVEVSWLGGVEGPQWRFATKA
jgi:hypothetical protein